MVMQAVSVSPAQGGAVSARIPVTEGDEKQSRPNRATLPGAGG